MLKEKVDVNAPGKDGTPALHWVVRVDDIDTAKLLIKAGANVKVASGQLVDGTKLNSAGDLRNAMLSRPEMFVSTATKKLLTYAVGRTAQYYDMSAIRSIVRGAAQNDYRFSSLILGIVESDAFLKKKKM